MVDFSVAWMLLVIVGFGLATPLEATSDNDDLSPPSYWTPENCPYNDTTTHVCSRLYNFTAPCISITCCEWMGEQEESADAQDFKVDGNVYLDNRNGVECSEVCFEVRRCLYSVCFSECCPGYIGECQNHTDVWCRNGGTMSGTDYYPYCNCPMFFYGRFCELQYDHLPCLNGGTKMQLYSSSNYYCRCAPGFKGNLCEQPVCECRNNARCQMENGQPVCRCPDGFYGKQCELYECGITCYNGGTCVSDGYREVCICTAPYVGTYCETEHIQSTECSAPKSFYPAMSCVTECEKDADCFEVELCCQAGCSRQCKRPRSAACTHDGVYFAVGQVYTIGECRICTCTESGSFVCNGTEVCPKMTCDQGQLVKGTKQCCPVCSDVPFIKCPRNLVHIEVLPYSNIVQLTIYNTYVTAWDGRKEPPRVWFEPEYLEHCECHTNSPGRIKRVSVYARDSYGGETKCQFMAYVVDRQPPRIKTCPKNVFWLESEREYSPHSRATDNVGISSERSGRKELSRDNTYIKEYFMEWYTYYDYDENTATCSFNVSIYKKDTPRDLLPLEIRQRLEEEEREFRTKLGYILGIISGTLCLIALTVAFAIWKKKRRNGNRTCRSDRPLPPQTASSGRRFDNNSNDRPRQSDRPLSLQTASSVRRFDNNTSDRPYRSDRPLSPQTVSSVRRFDNNTSDRPYRSNRPLSPQTASSVRRFDNNTSDRPYRSDRILPPPTASSDGSFDNNIYHLPTEAEFLTPPPYSPPSEPPPYSQVEESISPPEYTESEQK